jgi:hypothetical protein
VNSTEDEEVTTLMEDFLADKTHNFWGEVPGREGIYDMHGRRHHAPYRTADIERARKVMSREREHRVRGYESM